MPVTSKNSINPPNLLFIHLFKIKKKYNNTLKTEWHKPEKNNTYYNSEKNNGYFIQSEPNSILFHIKKWDGRSTLSVQEKSGVLFLVLAEDFVFLIILVCNITFCGSDYLLRMQWQTTDILMWLLNDRHINVTFEA